MTHYLLPSRLLRWGMLVFRVGGAAHRGGAGGCVIRLLLFCRPLAWGRGYGWWSSAGFWSTREGCRTGSGTPACRTTYITTAYLSDISDPLDGHKPIIMQEKCPEVPKFGKTEAHRESTQSIVREIEFHNVMETRDEEEIGWDGFLIC